MPGKTIGQGLAWLRPRLLYVNVSPQKCPITHLPHCSASTMSPLGQLGRFYIVMTLGNVTGEPMGARNLPTPLPTWVDNPCIPPGAYYGLGWVKGH